MSKNHRLTYIIILVWHLSLCLSAQHENKKWYFGNKAGLDFMTSPPAILTNGAMNASEGCASISDAAGNLLFYAKGDTVYDRTHNIMANGTGLFGDLTPTQAPLIVKKPGSQNLFYVFTVQGYTGTAGFNYSLVDMNLAAGNGSVIIKNSLIYSGQVVEKLTGALHCNQTDVWIVIHEKFTANYRSYLLSSSGVNTTAVVSTVGSTSNLNWVLGCMKISANGKKLGSASFGGIIEVLDFDNTTGVISNALTLSSSSSNTSSYGVEFSPDGNLFYVSQFGGTTGKIWQYNLCSASSSVIIASQYTIPAPLGAIWSMQLAPDGKIYCAHGSTLGVINNPNGIGTLCSYLDAGQSIAPKITDRSLPNFIAGSASLPPTPFSYTTLCQSVSFTSPPFCSFSNAAPLNQSWSFGDLNSGAANTSTVSNPTHIFSSAGNYTVQLINNFPCYSDTIKLAVNISGVPVLSVSGTYTLCNGSSGILTANGANSYVWNIPNGNTSSNATISISPSVSSVYTVVGTSTAGCSATKTIAVTLSECLGTKDFKEEIPFNVFPNPISDVLSFDTKIQVSLFLYNPAGELILEKQFEAGNHLINTTSFSCGLYSLKAISNYGVKTLKIVKLE